MESEELGAVLALYAFALMQTTSDDPQQARERLESFAGFLLTAKDRLVSSEARKTLTSVAEILIKSEV